MEKKTDLSEEFGHSSNLASREFGTNFARLDPRTNLSPELNRSPNSNALELSGAHTNKEFSTISDDSASTKRVASPKMSRREQHRQSLLLQMSAVGLSVVVVTNSFGQDILGDDMLFAEPVSSSIVISEAVNESEEGLETIDYVIYSTDEASDDLGPFEDTVRYDKASNTLYLDDCWGVDGLDIDHMGEDFTIFVESNSHVGILSFNGTNCTISGNQGASLFVNQLPLGKARYSKELLDDEEDWWGNQDENGWHGSIWWYGIVMYGEGGDVSLTVSPDITMKVRGADGAIAVDNTTANPGIDYNPAYTSVSGHLQSGDFPFDSGLFVEGGAPDWTIVDDDGNIVKRITFNPIGDDITSSDE